MRAPAKINLVLSVGALRPDGYHDLATVFHAVGLYDELHLVREEPGAAASVEVRGEDADRVPLGADNLALRAVALLAERTGADPAVHVLIDKRIPVAGGCAGGSADAAAALVGCDALWGTEVEPDALAALAAELGSDVPFSLQGGTALGTGRGERLTPIGIKGSLHWVLAVADGSLATPAVYAELDRQRAGVPLQTFHPEQALAALAADDPAALGRVLCNDLESAALALRPGLRTVLDTAMHAGALGAVVSGSGPTVAVLTRDAAHAKSLKTALLEVPGCRAVRSTEGPANGAHLVDAA